MRGVRRVWVSAAEFSESVYILFCKKKRPIGRFSSFLADLLEQREHCLWQLICLRQHRCARLLDNLRASQL